MAVLGDRYRALLVAAALPGIGRSVVFRIHPEAVEVGYPLLRAGSEIGSSGTDVPG